MEGATSGIIRAAQYPKKASLRLKQGPAGAEDAGAKKQLLAERQSNQEAETRTTTTELVAASALADKSL